MQTRIRQLCARITEDRAPHVFPEFFRHTWKDSPSRTGLEDHVKAFEPFLDEFADLITGRVIQYCIGAVPITYTMRLSWWPRLGTRIIILKTEWAAKGVDTRFALNDPIEFKDVHLKLANPQIWIPLDKFQEQFEQDWVEPKVQFLKSQIGSENFDTVFHSFVRFIADSCKEIVSISKEPNVSEDIEKT